MTDGDQIFITTNPDIVEMRSKERSFNIPEDIHAKKIEMEATIENFKNYFANNLKLNKLGIFSNQMTVLGDLSSHIQNLNQEIGLPIAMLKTLEVAAFKVNIALYKVSDYGYTFESYNDNEKIELLRMKDFASIFNTIKIQNTNKSLKDLINMRIYRSVYSNENILKLLSKKDFELFKKAVYEYTEASRNILSSLQMQEIDSAKTGLSVDLHKYPFLSNIQDCNINNKNIKLSYYPTWFLFLRKRTMKIPGAYSSTSIPGKIFMKINENSNKIDNLLKNNIDLDNKPITLKRIINTNLCNDYPDITVSIKNLMGSYADERLKLRDEKKKQLFFNKDEKDSIEQLFKIKEHDLCIKYNTILNILKEKNNIHLDVITNICYNLCIESIDGFYKRSFLMNAWKDEFLIYLSERKANQKIYLHRARIYPEYNYNTFISENIEIKDNIIYLNNKEIGNIFLKDGAYILNTIKNNHFIVEEKSLTNIEEKKNSFKLYIHIEPNKRKLIKEKEVYIFKPISQNNRIITGIYTKNNILIATIMHYGYIPEYNYCNFMFNIKNIKTTTATIECFIKNDSSTEIINNYSEEKYYLSNIIEENKDLFNDKRINISIDNVIKYINILNDINCYIHICKNDKESIIASDMFYVKENNRKAIELLQKMHKEYKIV